MLLLSVLPASNSFLYIFLWQPKTKKFIDKKNAVTFNLVHRSQKDPLAADESAPQRVLVPISAKPEKRTDHAGPSKVSVQ